MKKIVVYLEGLLPYFIVFAGVLGLVSISAFIGIIVSENVACFVGELLDTRTEGKKETLKFLGWVISGIIAFFGLLAINRRAAAQDENNRLIEKGHDQDRLKAEDEKLAKKQTHNQDRFKTAVDHLSNTESEIARIASFHELFRIANDNKDDYAQTVLDILCTHLRKITKYEDIEIYEEVYDHPEEVKVLARVLFGKETGKAFDGLHFDLRQVNLTGIDLKGIGKPKEIDFSFADLSHAIFNGTDLSGANFSEATLFDAKFVKAILQDALFPKAVLNLADLTGADFSRANMEKAELRHTTCSMTDFHHTTLINADLREADLREAKNLLTAILPLAKHNEGEEGRDEIFPSGFIPDSKGTQFPDGFIPKDNGMDYQPLSLVMPIKK